MKSGYLPVEDGHTLYYEIHGASEGKPAVILHGGPGGGLQRSALRSFDLRKWCVLLFDQRGCGRSRPFLSTHANTTWHLVADIEALRTHVGIEKWMVFGGSWGSTLALAYASRHGDRVSGMVLRGVCLMEPWETEWLYGPAGAARLFPREWAAFSGGQRRATAKSLMRSYGRRFRRASTRRAAARAWWGYEAAVSHLRPQPDTTPDRGAEGLAILEHHYFSHNAWLRPGQLLAAARHMNFPVAIVQGRYDVVCPPAAAVALTAALPKARLTLTIAGHAGSEPETAKGLHAAVAAMAAP
jgi:proline iminopeptidase